MKKYQLTFYMEGTRDYSTVKELDNIASFVENIRFLDHFHIEHLTGHQLINLKYMISLEAEELHEWPRETAK